jgi:aspartokinase-like uncharacterized kinase
VASELTVVKVGGSLYDLPDLGKKLWRWLEQTVHGDVVLLPGGGRSADVVREWEHWHDLREEDAHWLALRALSVNAYFLRRLLPKACVVNNLHVRALFASKLRMVPVLDPLYFAAEDDQQPDHLPHTWDVTSDSIAAHAAVRTGARSLVLLKSVTVPPEMSWAEASQLGFVDVMFPRLIEQAGPKLRVEAINFREWQP